MEADRRCTHWRSWDFGLLAWQHDPSTFVRSSPSLVAIEQLQGEDDMTPADSSVSLLLHSHLYQGQYLLFWHVFQSAVPCIFLRPFVLKKERHLVDQNESPPL